MSKKIDIEGILEEYRKSNHLNEDQLLQLAIKGDNLSENKAFQSHVDKCEICSQELRQILDDLEDAKFFDGVSLNIAAGLIKKPVRIQTDGNKYKISIFPVHKSKDKGLIRLEVIDEKFKEEMEGKDIVIMDGKNNILLKGQIIKGRISQKINNLQEIELSTITVQPKL